ncbi:3-isopropylmalate dehydratase small subunit 3-like protein [Tanacetum coccineum]
MCYVVRDNIDTDQIIQAEYCTLVPTNPNEYEKLGSYALMGLPDSYETRFVEPGIGCDWGDFPSWNVKGGFVMSGKTGDVSVLLSLKMVLLLIIQVDVYLLSLLEDAGPVYLAGGIFALRTKFWVINLQNKC